jgi:hypothetical protein
MFFVEAKAMGSVSGQGYQATKLQELLEQFALSGCQAVELIYSRGEYSSATSACLSVRSAIQRSHYNFGVSKMEGRVFLYRNYPAEHERA